MEHYANRWSPLQRFRSQSHCRARTGCSRAGWSWRAPFGWTWKVPQSPQVVLRASLTSKRVNAAIVLLSQATHSRLLFFFKQEHTVNNGNFVLQLNLRERVRYSPTDVLRVAGLALKDDTQTDDRRKRRDTRLSQPGCHRRDL